MSEPTQVERDAWCAQCIDSAIELLKKREGGDALLPEGAPDVDIFHELAVLSYSANLIAQQCAARAKLMRGTIASDKRSRDLCRDVEQDAHSFASTLSNTAAVAALNAAKMRKRFPALGRRPR